MIDFVSWVYYGLKVFVYSPLRVTFDKEHREVQLKRIFGLQMNPDQGLASTWDYQQDLFIVSVFE